MEVAAVVLMMGAWVCRKVSVLYYTPTIRNAWLGVFDMLQRRHPDLYARLGSPRSVRLCRSPFFDRGVETAVDWAERIPDALDAAALQDTQLRYALQRARVLTRRDGMMLGAFWGLGIIGFVLLVISRT